MIKNTVGQGGKNETGDVMYVQFLLADWLVSDGQKPIVIDGICGPRTLEAIVTFQKKASTVSDGRFDPNGPGIA